MKNGFVKKSVGTLTLGEKLKRIRSDRRMSLHEVSKNTRIQVKYLEYLEEGRYEKLPAEVYVKGFLRNYADFLGVDDQALIKLYEKERGIKKNLEKSKKQRFNGGKFYDSFHRKSQEEETEISPMPVRIRALVITPRMIALGCIIVLVFSGVFYLYKEVGSFASTPRLVVINPSANYSTDGNSVMIEGITERDARLFINDQPVLVDDEGKFREELAVQSGANVVNIKAVNRFEKETVEVVTIQSSFQEQEANKESSYEEIKEGDISSKKGVQVEVRVDPGPVWLSIETDGNLVFSGTMLTGAAQSFQAEGKIVINSGKGSATFVKFNDKDIGALSDNPAPVRGVTFTADTKY